MTRSRHRDLMLDGVWGEGLCGAAVYGLSRASLAPHPPLSSHAPDPSSLHGTLPTSTSVLPTTLSDALSELDRAVSAEHAELDRVLDELRTVTARVAALERAVRDATPPAPARRPSRSPLADETLAIVDRLADQVRRATP